MAIVGSPRRKAEQGHVVIPISVEIRAAHEAKASEPAPAPQSLESDRPEVVLPSPRLPDQGGAGSGVQLRLGEIERPQV